MKTFTTPIGTLLYSSLFDPRDRLNSEGKTYKKYTATIAFSKEQKAEIKPIYDEIFRLLQEIDVKHTNPFSSPLSPLIDQETSRIEELARAREKLRDPDFTLIDPFEFRLRTDTTVRKPEVMDTRKSIITDKGQVFNGCKVRLSVSLVIRDRPDFGTTRATKFVKAYLHNVLFIATGDRMEDASSSPAAPSTTAADDFANFFTPTDDFFA
jgi:hypothetical protein